MLQSAEIWHLGIVPTSESIDHGKDTKFVSATFNLEDISMRKLRYIVLAGIVTFLYSSKEEQLNNAVALKEYIESIFHAKAV